MWLDTLSLRPRPREEALVPLIRVELFDFRMSDETSEELIAGMTDALCRATHEGLRDHTWVIVEGHSPKNWGLGGKPWPVQEMPGIDANASASAD
jgi:phenylpyruvate tautomerase PptA (4-oxalocrotonate tautomerase family)